MYLIFVMARTVSPATLKKGSIKKLPEHDLKPVMVAINRSDPEYFVREHDSRRSGTKQDKNYADIPRIFCKLSESGGSLVDQDDPHKSMCDGKAQMAVVLATIVLPAKAAEPESDEFVKYVAQRSRLADRIVVAGYTDDRLSMRKSEILGLERARTVKRMLEEEQIKVPITAVARPKCNYSKLGKLSNRVEVTALFFSDVDSKQETEASPERSPQKPKSKKRAASMKRRTGDE
ncbi:MAG: hypothetical protein OXC81_01715 [Betaproteobacteria bacterium]|nr:hypothetical protein [Betaproteobacteria bacterium]